MITIKLKNGWTKTSYEVKKNGVSREEIQYKRKGGYNVKLDVYWNGGYYYIVKAYRIKKFDDDYYRKDDWKLKEKLWEKQYNNNSYYSFSRNQKLTNYEKAKERAYYYVSMQGKHKLHGW